jgi:guanylate kinase
MGAILVVSGPSGSGKTTLARKVCEKLNSVYFSISTTTRNIRNGEENGVDYFFTTKEDFLQRITAGDFLEWAEVHGNFYGTSFAPINDALSSGKLVVLDIDVQGHRSIKEKYNGMVTSVFVTTKDLSTLKQRLSARDTESKESMDQRMLNAFDEMRHITEYDYFLINENFEDSLNALASIANAARFKQTKFNLDSILSNWKR